MEGRQDDLSYVQLMEKDDTAKRMKMLFKPDEAEGAAEEGGYDATEALNDAYETVNEGETTDTTSGLDDDALFSRSEDPNTATTKREVATEKAAKVKVAPVVEEGIKSSDDEEEVEAEEKVEETLAEVAAAKQ